VQQEGLNKSKKNPTIPSETELTTFRLAAQLFNQLRYCLLQEVEIKR
jgi:hypothetical protein